LHASPKARFTGSILTSPFRAAEQIRPAPARCRAGSKGETMQRFRLSALALAFLAGCSAATTSNIDTSGLPSRFDSEVMASAPDQALFDAAVLIHANRARAAHGRAPLRSDGRLVKAAADHAGNMARLRTHSHRLPVAGEGRLVQRMDRNNVSFRTAGENIGMEKLYRLVGRPIATEAEGCRFTYADTKESVPVHSYASLAESAVRRWMASPKHRDALLSPKFGRIGSGFGVDPRGPACGDVYLVQNFAD
jgi:uncharacterized protein YkwD